jgi:hypothetical protein
MGAAAVGYLRINQWGLGVNHKAEFLLGNQSRGVVL